MRQGESHEEKKKKDKRNYFITAVMCILNVVNKVDCFHICVKYLYFLHLLVILCGTS